MSRIIVADDDETIVEIVRQALADEPEPDEMVTITSGDLLDKYQATKTETLILLDGLRQQTGLTEAERAELISRLHNRAGTGAYFGDGDLGIAAATFERALDNALPGKIKAIMDAHASLFIAPEARRVA